MHTHLRAARTAVLAAAMLPAAIAGPAGGDDELVVTIQQILDASIEPGAIDWNCCGADLPPTGVSVGVRVPTREDIVLSSGVTLDGRPFEPTNPFSTATLGWAAVIDLAIGLVDAGILDADATIDRWLPDAPNADRVTVQMLIDSTHGWGGYLDVLLASVADPNRVWTSGEAASTLNSIPPEAEPGTFVLPGQGAGLIALGHIAEQVTGSSLADLVTEHVTAPAGLGDTFLADGSNLPPGYQHARLSVPGSPIQSTADGSLVAFMTYAPADGALISTIPDLLDMLDTWVDGTWRADGAPPAPDLFPADRADGTYNVMGLGVPYNGYCPCTATGDGTRVDAIGRAPYRAGTDLHMLYFPDDEISIVLHFNSDTWMHRSQVTAVVDVIRAAVQAAR